MSYNKEEEQLVSYVEKKDQVKELDKICQKLGLSRGYVIRRFTDDGIDKYHTKDKNFVGTALDPMMS